MIDFSMTAAANLLLPFVILYIVLKLRIFDKVSEQFP